MAPPRRQDTSLVLKDYVRRLVVADSDVEPGIETTISIPIADAATGDVDVVLGSKFEVTDILVQKRSGAGGAANTVQVKNGATVISDAISINIADQTRATWATIDDAASVIAAGGTLRVTRTKAGGNAACLVLVRGFIRA